MPDLTFEHAVLLVPLATLAHVLEEWPRFPAWARQFASPRYSDREYRSVHLMTIAIALVSSAIVARYPPPWLLFPFFLLVLAPGAFWNAFFHTGASLASRRVCPGVATGVLLYLPLTAVLSVLATRESLLAPGSLAAAFFLALPLHVLEVGHNVFKRW